MEKILISSCLLGHLVRYNAQLIELESLIIKDWQNKGVLLHICPEVVAGMTVPRIRSEIIGSSKGVFEAGDKVVSQSGFDNTQYFIDGAHKALELCKKHNIKMAILKKNSPSCGNKNVFDGTFSNNIIDGIGTTVYVLQKNGIIVFNEDEISSAKKYYDIISCENDNP